MDTLVTALLMEEMKRTSPFPQIGITNHPEHLSPHLHSKQTHPTPLPKMMLTPLQAYSSAPWSPVLKVEQVEGWGTTSCPTRTGPSSHT